MKMPSKASSRERLELLDQNKKISTGLVRQKLLKTNMQATITVKNTLDKSESDKTTGLVFEKPKFDKNTEKTCFFQ